jgi:alanine racemase
MPRPIQAIIDLPALRHNLARCREAAGGRKLWAVVKANAYGHGIENAVRAFAAADGLGLLDLAEAERARAAGWTRPILLLEGIFAAQDLEAVEALDLTIVVHNDDQLAWLAAARPQRRLAVYLKLNTGMNRLGFVGAEVQQALTRLQALRHVQLAALMTHFANADRASAEEGPASVVEQLQRFAEWTQGWTGERCLANSSALFLQPSAGGDAVRPGIALYGGTPMGGTPAARYGLRAGMHLRARLIAVRDVDIGAVLGYGARWTARQPTRVGVVACGYADGYPRVAPDGTPVAVEGQRVSLVGRVSMDMVTVDLSQVPTARVGSEVELWGDLVPIDEVAERAGTVGYELMCALAARVPQRVIES